MENVKIEVLDSDFDKSVNHEESQKEMSLTFWVEARAISRRTEFLKKMVVAEHTQPKKKEVVVRFRYFSSPVSVREAAAAGEPRRIEGVGVESTELHVREKAENREKRVN